MLRGSGAAKSKLQHSSGTYQSPLPPILLPEVVFSLLLLEAAAEAKLVGAGVGMLIQIAKGFSVLNLFREETQCCEKRGSEEFVG